MHLHTRTRTFFGENIFSILRAQAHSASTLEYIYIYIYTGHDLLAVRSITLGTP